MFPDSPTAREQIEESLEAFLAEGLKATPDDRLAKEYLKLVEVFWCDQPLREKERISGLYRRAFGIDEVKDDDPLTKPQGDFEAVVGSGGWFGDFLAYTKPAKAMPQLFFGAAVALISAGMARRPLISWTAEDLYPNVYVLLIGDTGAGKGSAIKRALKIIRPAMVPHVLPTEGSQQGYADYLKQRFDERGGTFADGLIIAEELRMLLSEEKYKAQLTVWLTAWYSHEGEWSRALRGNDDCKFNDPYVCTLFASNMSWLRLTPGDAILGGFWPRFLKFHTPEDQIRWPKFMPEFDDELGEDLTRRLAEANDNIPDVVKLSPDALIWAERWHNETLRPIFEREPHARIQDWYQRMNAHVMKLACVWQFADGELKDTLDEYWLKKAWGVMQWMRHTVHYMYGSIGVSKNSMILEDVLERMKRDGGKMENRKLIRALRGKYRAGEVRAAINELQMAGDIGKNQEVTEGIVWELARKGKNGEVGK